MFILPKVLRPNDKVVLQGETSYERRQITVGLVTGYDTPDHSNVACQFNINFNDPDKIAIQIIDNGNVQTVHESSASDLFTEPPFFEIYFAVRSEDVLEVGVGESYLDSIRLRHSFNNIRFLTVNGDLNKVSRLDFSFG